MGALSLQISLILLLQVAAAVVSIPSAAPPLPGRKGLIIGAWVPIKDIKDPYISEIAGFAVNEYNKESSAKLKFEKVLSGESQVVAGTNYRLIIAATDGTTTRNYEAVVWEQHKLWVNIRQLTSFKPVTH
ncbi:hypothetical protein SAY87_021661 [Trapa incisa]|uniref:Cystatin domain-containing protein n=2 Tax=Trapa TaxID=22665 RepID=A0AAN7MIA4_TRANT|nr:hypothetical protein SAY87_021661 [Trapa incisa]KAK4804446.1 hypothetical protein SAY86_004263 [Trapa natans]